MQLSKILSKKFGALCDYASLNGLTDDWAVNDEENIWHINIEGDEQHSFLS